MLWKNKRIVNKELLKTYHTRRCICCGGYPAEPCHIHSVGAGGNDEEDNLLAMDRRCHQFQHSHGFLKLCELYPHVKDILLEKGWKFEDGKLRRVW